MASPQPDKFTKVANELLEQVPKFKFNGTQLRIILIIWRFTYGFRRKDHEFSLTFLSHALGTHKNVISRELKYLIEKRVLKVVSEETYTDSRTLRFIKDYSTWLVEVSTNQLTVNQLVDTQSTNQLTPPVNQSVDQERKRSFKENIKESNGEVMANIPYQTILDYLNLKAGKRFTTKSKPTIEFINGRFKEGRTVEDFIHVIDVKVAQWLDDPKMNEFLRPATLFNATNFEGYLNQKMPVKQLSKVEQGNEEMLAMYRRAADEENGNSQTVLRNLEGVQELRED